MVASCAWFCETLVAMVPNSAIPSGGGALAAAPSPYGPPAQELSGTPNPRYLLKSIAGTNGRRIAVQIGGVLQYKLEVHCSVSLSPKPRSQQGTALPCFAIGNGAIECDT